MINSKYFTQYWQKCQNCPTAKNSIISQYLVYMFRNHKQYLCHIFLPPANEVCEGYVFTGVCLSTLGGGCAWFYLGGGMCGFIQGGMCGFIRGVHGFIWGGVVLFGGHAWFYLRGYAWVFQGGVHGFFSLFGYNEIRSMSGRYASYWNAFLFKICQHII